MTSGGTFFQFRAGSTGGSANYLEYVSRSTAVRDRLSGVLLWNLHLDDSSYTALRNSLLAFAWVRERAETRAASPAQVGHTRTYYHAKLSFERDVGTETALSLCAAWLLEVFPAARAAAFVHRNTSQMHIHLWMDARDTEEKKLQIGWRKYRSLDESWNRLYCAIVERSPEEHLQKKQETQRARRDGRPLPTRANRTKGRDWYLRHELRTAGMPQAHLETPHEPEQEDTYRNKPATPNVTPNAPHREQEASGREQEAPLNALQDAAKVGAAEQAVSEAHQLHSEVTNLVEKERRNIPERGR